MISTDDILAAVKAAVFDTTQISNETIISMIQAQIDAIGSDDKYRCLVLFNSLIDALTYLRNKWNVDTSTASGGASGRMEKVGQVQVQVDYANGTFEGNPWTDILADYLTGETAIAGCGVISDIKGKVLIGGVDRKETERVAHTGVNGLHGVAAIDSNRHHHRFKNRLFK